MPAPTALPPDEALHAITRHSKEPRGVEVDLDDALGHFLLEDIAGPELVTGFPGDPIGLRRACVDGYALSAPGRPADDLRIVAAEADLGPDCAWRVPIGAPLPESAVAVASLPAVVLLAHDRLRLEAAVPAGHHVLRVRQGPSLAAGTRVDARLQAALRAGGRERLRVGRRPRLGLVDLGRGLEPPGRPRAPNQVPDLAGDWIPLAAEQAGWETVRLGRGASTQNEFQQAFRRGLARAVDLLLIVGGTGDGVEDRAAEWIVGIDGQVRVERVALEGAETLLWGKISRMDVIGISGAPLATALSWDVFVVPYVLHRAGAPRSVWDWSAVAAPPGIPAPRAATPGRWTARPARWITAEGEAFRRLEVLEALGPFAPGAASADGWLLFPPADDSPGAPDPAGDDARAPARAQHTPNTDVPSARPDSGARWCALTASGRGL